MGTVVAYIIVIILVRFAFSIGGMPAILWGLGICWAPERVRCITGGLIDGISSALAAIAFGWLVFRYVAGPLSFGGFALMATILPLYIPIRNDLVKCRKLRKLEKDLSGAVKEAIGAAASTYSFSLVMGEVLGLTVGALWMLR